MPDDVNADISSLRHMAREFTEGFNGRDVDRLMRFYGDTYVDVNLRHPVQSHQERRAYYLQVMSRGDIRIDVQPDEILVRGEFAFVRGTIKLQRTEEAKTVSTELRYMEIARKSPDGSWKAIWGMDGAVQEYEPLRSSS